MKYAYMCDTSTREWNRCRIRWVTNDELLISKSGLKHMQQCDRDDDCKVSMVKQDHMQTSPMAR